MADTLILWVKPKKEQVYDIACISVYIYSRCRVHRTGSFVLEADIGNQGKQQFGKCGLLSQGP
jgi:hypothetical protein